MIGSLYSGITGLKANSTALAVIGDNLANVNTTAFKSSTISFADLLSDSVAGSSSSEVGKGVEVQQISADWKQGIIEGTGNSTDVAINGDGFFVLENQWGQNFYSRAGEFDFDEDGILVNPDGLDVQGYPVTGVNDDGSLDLGTMGKIDISNASSPPVATDEISTEINLDADADVGDTFSTTVSAYDSLGNTTPITIEFTRTATGWDWSASWPDSISADPPVTGSMEFDSDGNLVSPTANPTISITNLKDNASDLNVTWNILDDDGTSNGDITGYAYTSVTNSTSKNGNGLGVIQGVSVDKSGVVYGEFSNGEKTALYQLAIADFSNENGLNSLGNNLFEETINSGDVVFGTAGVGGIGEIRPESLEMSNSDITTGLVDMINVQSAYNANAKVITTTDEMLDVVINLIK